VTYDLKKAVSGEMGRPLCKLVPHKLIHYLRGPHATTYRELRDPLKEEQAFDFPRIVTGEESWTSLQYSPDHMWACSLDEVPRRADQTRTLEKFMLAVHWGAGADSSFNSCRKEY
jgi:hypothetical protein